MPVRASNAIQRNAKKAIKKKFLFERPIFEIFFVFFVPSSIFNLIEKILFKFVRNYFKIEFCSIVINEFEFAGIRSRAGWR